MLTFSEVKVTEFLANVNVLKIPFTVVCVFSVVEPVAGLSRNTAKMGGKWSLPHFHTPQNSNPEQIRSISLFARGCNLWFCGYRGSGRLKRGLNGIPAAWASAGQARKDLGGSSSGSEHKSDIRLCKSCPPEKALGHCSVISRSSRIDNCFQ